MTLTACLSEAIVHADLILCHFSGLALVCLLVWLQMCCYHTYMIFIHFCCLSLIAPRQGYKGQELLWLFKLLQHHHSGEMERMLCFLKFHLLFDAKKCCQIALAITGHSSKYPEENTKGSFMFQHK